MRHKRYVGVFNLDNFVDSSCEVIKYSKHESGVRIRIQNPSQNPDSESESEFRIQNPDLESQFGFRIRIRILTRIPNPDSEFGF
uniref:Uncharacterized protein n=1 Tax=Acrobeloides nanus TaxID=290746 RepID=A0A914DMR6_9BILA